MACKEKSVYIWGKKPQLYGHLLDIALKGNVWWGFVYGCDQNDMKQYKEPNSAINHVTFI